MSIIKQMVIKRINSYYDGNYTEIVEEVYTNLFHKKITMNGLEKLTKKELYFLEKEIELKLKQL